MPEPNESDMTLCRNAIFGQAELQHNISLTKMLDFLFPRLHNLVDH